MTGASAQGSWLEDAADLVALPGEEKPDTGELWRMFMSGGADKIIGVTDAPARPARWAGLLAKHASRDAFLLFAYSPGQVLRGFSSKEMAEPLRWSTLVELYEAWLEVVSGGRLGFLDERSRRIGSAYLTRTRWLLLSLPFRPGWEGRIEHMDLIRINTGSARILTLARQARDSWLEVLGQIDDYPKLKQDINVEDDAADMAVLPLTRERLGQSNPKLPLCIQEGGPEQDFVGDEAVRYVLTRLLLPRFALSRVWRIVFDTASPGLRAARNAAVGVLVLTLATLTAGLVDQGSGVLRWVPLGAIAWYAIIAVSAVIRPVTAWPWLMRQPASAAAGLLAIAVAPPDWWNASGRQWHIALWAVLLLAAVGTGYLYVEAGSQDVRGRRRLWRPLAVAAAGYLHAVMVSVIGLRFLLPAFAQHPAAGPQLSCWWQPSGCGPDALPSWLLVLAAASWSFAAAVFLQIIWDDQPVTAPLAHASWHRKD